MSSVSIQGNASGTGIFTIASPNSNTNRTLTLPDSTGTVVVTGGAQTIEFAAGSASTPSITTTGDTNTGIFFPAADTIAFAEGGAEVARFDSSGNLGIGSSPAAWGASGVVFKAVQLGTASSVSGYSGGNDLWLNQNAYFDGSAWKYVTTNPAANYGISDNNHIWRTAASGTAGNTITFTERARILGDGKFLVGKTSASATTTGFMFYNPSSSDCYFEVVNNSVFSTDPCLMLNRQTSDGTLVEFKQGNTVEGTISVSGTTVSYNGGNLSRWAQMPGTKDDTLVKGTVMSNLDEMNVYTKDGEPVDNEQLNKVKVSDVEGDVNVAGVFVNWTYDDAHQVDEINMAMTGDMIIRIAQGVVVQKGDLLMSAGDGTAKPQGDDIVRSKTVAKVTSNHVTCTYADGSYCVPCVLMAC